MTTYSLQKHNGSWQMRWSVYKDGKRSQPVHIIGPDSMKKHEAEALAAVYFAKVRRSPTIQAGASVDTFVTDVFFPHCDANLADDTIKLYKQQWKRLKPFIGETHLRDVCTPHIQSAIDAVHNDRGETLSHSVYIHVKVTCSAMFSLAIRRGDHPGPNPADECVVRNYGHTEHNENGAYDLNQVKQYMTLFADDKDILAAIAINAWLALRKPEVESLKPSDYDPSTGLIRVHKHTKTGNDIYLPVVGPLRPVMLQGWDRIDMRRAETAIRLRLEGTTLRWKGWYAFRRGMMTNLYDLGVPPEKACHVLRNTAEVCRKHYLRLDKTATRQNAMDTLEAAYDKQPVIAIQ
jgi:hypothetical protein